MIKPIWRAWHGRELVAGCRPSALCGNQYLYLYLYLHLHLYLYLYLHLYLYLYLCLCLYHDNEATCTLLVLICVIEVILRNMKMKKMLMMMIDMIIIVIFPETLAILADLPQKILEMLLASKKLWVECDLDFLEDDVDSHLRGKQRRCQRLRWTKYQGTPGVRRMMMMMMVMMIALFAISI